MAPSRARLLPIYSSSFLLHGSARGGVCDGRSHVSASTVFSRFLGRSAPVPHAGVKGGHRELQNPPGRLRASPGEGSATLSHLTAPRGWERSSSGGPQMKRK